MVKFSALIIGTLCAAPVLAQTGASSTPPKAKDPNRKVCEKVEKIGSRLGAVTVCMTAREWEDLRRNHRSDLERVQQVVNQAPGG